MTPPPAPAPAPAATGVRRLIARLTAHEELNFLLTNRIPRRLATRVMGHFSRIEWPPVRRASIALWRLFSDVDLSDAAETRFASLHEAFIRRLRAGARAADPDAHVLASPCDAIVGAHGRIEGDRLYQIKGFPYRLGDLMTPEDAAAFRDGTYVTLRLTAGMYHRFHAPADLTVESVTYVSGDTWNVNPIALRRIERLYCRNERAIIRTRLADGGAPLLLVPVAAILVASIRLTFLDIVGALRTGGPRRIACSATLAKGEEMGWFEHGSTIIVFARPEFSLVAGLADGDRIRAGQALLRCPQ